MLVFRGVSKGSFAGALVLKIHLLDPFMKACGVGDVAFSERYGQSHPWAPKRACLSGGFKYFLCSPLFGEDFQFD